MKRNCNFLIESKDGRRAIFIDKENEAEIKSFINQTERYRKKFQTIATIILDGHRIPDLYDKEDINGKCKDVTAMKFFKGQENFRIYCKEVSSANGVRIVIAAIVHQKKDKGISKKDISQIEKVGGYQYEI